MNRSIKPITSKDDLAAMAAWIKDNAAPKYHKCFMEAVTTGKRLREVLEQSVEQVSLDGFLRVLKRAAEACDLGQNVGTHTLRKTWAYFRLQDGEDIAVVQRILGHLSPETTKRYIGIEE